MTKWQWAATALVACLYASLFVRFPDWMHEPTPAQEIRLIGECNGKFYGGMEEDEFPAGCAWIEPVRFDTE